MQNACMLFDEQTLLPKYQLSMGQPGSSYTFEVAQKIGLPAALVDRAKGKLDQRKVKLDKLLITLQTKKNQLNKETHLLQEEKSKLRKEIASKEKEAARLAEREADLNYEEHKKLIEKGKKYDALLAFWEKSKDKKELLKRVILASEKEQARKAEKLQRRKDKPLATVAQKQGKTKGSQKKKQPEKPLQVGDNVRLATGKEKGTILQINRDKATVLFGMMKTIVLVKDLRHASAKTTTKG